MGGSDAIQLLQLPASACPGSHRFLGAAAALPARARAGCQPPVLLGVESGVPGITAGDCDDHIRLRAADGEPPRSHTTLADARRDPGPDRARVFQVPWLRAR